VRPLHTLVLVVLAAVLLGVAASPARADGFITPFVGTNFGGDSNCPQLSGCQNKPINFGVSLGSMGTVFGFEEDIAFAKNFFGSVPGATSSVFTAMSNLMAGVGAGPVQPYVLVGLGVIRPHTSLTLGDSDFDKYALGYDIGGGVNGFFSKHVGVRGDIREMHTLQNIPFLGSVNNQNIFAGNQRLGFWRASVGIVFR
jgi:opacity protein-like surface antigen